MILDTSNLVAEALPVQDEPLRELICNFCDQEIIAFQYVSRYWAHLVYKHALIHKSVRLQEIRQTAAIHRATVAALDVEMIEKIAQAESPDFNWDVVMTWNLPKVYGGRKGI